MIRIAMGSCVCLCLVIAAFVVRLPASADAPITPAQFAELHAKLIQQSQSERWTQVPWITDIWEARQRALREGKPIFMWAMNGHPLGCT